MAVEDCSSHHTAPDIHYAMLFPLCTKKIAIFTQVIFVMLQAIHFTSFVHSHCRARVLCPYASHIWPSLTSHASLQLLLHSYSFCWLITLWAAVTTHTTTLSFTFLIHCVLHFLHFYFLQKLQWNPLNTAIASDIFGGNFKEIKKNQTDEHLAT